MLIPGIPNEWFMTMGILIFISSGTAMFLFNEAKKFNKEEK